MNMTVTKADYERANKLSVRANRIVCELLAAGRIHEGNTLDAVLRDFSYVMETGSGGKARRMMTYVEGAVFIASEIIIEPAIK
jgi:hypothetical protein